jgi:ATP-dependent DNA helicase RecQ
MSILYVMAAAHSHQNDSRLLIPEEGELPGNDPLRDYARENFRIDYLFPYQRLVISNILESAGSFPADTGPPSAAVPQDKPDEANPRDGPLRQLVILPTGSGKSLCFQLPSLLLEGATLVIYPLLSLMADQERRLKEAGITAALLKGGQSPEERRRIISLIQTGKARIILTNPETATSPKTLHILKQIQLSHIVIDEAHCICEWGESFRPVYLQLSLLDQQLSVAAVTAFTATASPLIMQRIKEHLFPELGCHVIEAYPDRPNISYRALPSDSKDHELLSLLRREVTASGLRTGADQRTAVKRPAIVFCRSRTGAALTAHMLRKRLQEKEIFFYHAGLKKEEKKSVEDWFFQSKNGILTSTCAYGMGVDKPDIRTVIHRDISPSVESYLQEAGRAGRDRKPADAVLLYSREDYTLCEKITDPFSLRRYRDILSYTAYRGCRREYLLSLLGHKMEACFGCDYCGGTWYDSPKSRPAVLSFIRKNRNRLTIKQAALALSGRINRTSIEEELHLLPGFGSLHGWNHAEIEEALHTMISEGKLQLRKGRLSNRSRRLLTS